MVGGAVSQLLSYLTAASSPRRGLRPGWRWGEGVPLVFNGIFNFLGIRKILSDRRGQCALATSDGFLASVRLGFRGWRSSLRLRSVAQAVSVDPSQERPRHLRIFSCPSSPHPRRALSSCRTPAEPSTHHTELTVPCDQVPIALSFCRFACLSPEAPRGAPRRVPSLPGEPG